MGLKNMGAILVHGIVKDLLIEYTYKSKYKIYTATHVKDIGGIFFERVA